MTTREILGPLTAVVTWPVSRFADMQRTYDVTRSPSDVRASLRGGLAEDPLYRPFGEGFAQSAQLEVVGRVSDERFEIYMSGRYASGIGLIGTVEQMPGGSRVRVRVGWTGLAKWIVPCLTVAALSVAAMFAPEALAEISGSGSEDWTTVWVVALVCGGQLAVLMTTANRARNDELPALFERLHSVLTTLSAVQRHTLA